MFKNRCFKVIKSSLDRISLYKYFQAKLDQSYLQLDSGLNIDFLLELIIMSHQVDIFDFESQQECNTLNSCPVYYILRSLHMIKVVKKITSPSPFLIIKLTTLGKQFVKYTGIQKMSNIVFRSYCSNTLPISEINSQTIIEEYFGLCDLISSHMCNRVSRIPIPEFKFWSFMIRHYNEYHKFWKYGLQHIPMRMNPTQVSVENYLFNTDELM